MSKKGKALDVNRKGLFLLKEYLIKTATSYLQSPWKMIAREKVQQTLI